MHLPYFLDNGIDLRLEVGTERFVEPLDIARLGKIDLFLEILSVNSIQFSLITSTLSFHFSVLDGEIYL